MAAAAPWDSRLLMKVTAAGGGGGTDQLTLESDLGSGCASASSGFEF